MAKYGIPKEVQPGLSRLMKLDQDQLKSLCKILENAKVGEGVGALSESKKDTTAGLSENELRSILVALFSMVNIFYGSKNDIETFVNDFVNSYEEVINPDDKKSLESLKVKLTAVLPFFGQLRLTIKSIDLLTENLNNFLECRSISDVRLVLDDDLSKKSEYAVIVHQLRIKYGAQAGRQDFFVTLDINDLKKLQETVQRAIDKDTALRNSNYLFEFIDHKY
jgi:hypothetical protein